jgi:hypothetical protein
MKKSLFLALLVPVVFTAAGCSKTQVDPTAPVAISPSPVITQSTAAAPPTTTMPSDSASSSTTTPSTESTPAAQGPSASSNPQSSQTTN